MIQIPEPPISKLLFSDTRTAFIWLAFRIYVGVQWLETGISKLNNPSWTGTNAGKALGSFVTNALTKTSGAHPDVQNWYAAFLKDFVLPNAEAFSYIVVFGEILVGIALIFGIFTGIAAFFGGFMNMNYLFAGTVSINPLMFLIELFLILAWRVSGWIGVDRLLLPKLGTPWLRPK